MLDSSSLQQHSQLSGIFLKCNKIEGIDTEKCVRPQSIPLDKGNWLHDARGIHTPKMTENRL